MTNLKSLNNLYRSLPRYVMAHFVYNWSWNLKKI